MVLAVAVAGQSAADDATAKIEAAYLFHLTKFVDWPGLPADDFRICVLGDEAVGGMLAELAGRQVGERTLKVEVDAYVDPARCQILFIGRNDARLSELLRRVRAAPVLTVGDREEFVRQGGMVGFYSEAGRIKLEINPEAARAANLHISAKLLEMARTVGKP